MKKEGPQLSSSTVENHTKPQSNTVRTYPVTTKRYISSPRLVKQRRFPRFYVVLHGVGHTIPYDMQVLCLVR